MFCGVGILTGVVLPETGLQILSEPGVMMAGLPYAFQDVDVIEHVTGVPSRSSQCLIATRTFGPASLSATPRQSSFSAVVSVVS